MLKRYTLTFHERQRSAESSIAGQKKKIEELTRAGHDTYKAQKLLSLPEETYK